MVIMEPVQVATRVLPTVTIGCEMDTDSTQAADRPQNCTRLPNSVFHGSHPALGPLSATRSFPLSFGNHHGNHGDHGDQGDFVDRCNDLGQHGNLGDHQRKTQLAYRLSGSHRKLHRANDEDDDVDEDIQSLATANFEETSEESDCDAYAELRNRSTKQTGNKLSVLMVEPLFANTRLSCRRTASFPIALSDDCGTQMQVQMQMQTQVLSASLSGIPVEIVQNLFIGDQSASFNQQVLKQLNVTHVVNVTKRNPNWQQQKGGQGPFKYLQIPINDHWSENLLPFLPQVVAFIDEARTNKCGAFIHCEAGVSRSASIIVAYVMQTFRMKLDDAYELVRKVKSDIYPNFAFMMQLKDFEKQLGLSNLDSTS